MKTCFITIVFLGFLSSLVLTEYLDAEKLAVKILVERRYSVELRYGWPTPGTEVFHTFITGLSLISPLMVPENRVLHGIHITNCFLPRTSLAAQFRNKNNDISGIFELQLTDSFMQPPVDNEFTENLPISSLQMSNVTYFDVPPSFFTSLTKLRELVVEKMDMPPLPPASLFPLQYLKLRNSFVKNWDNCEYLIELNIVRLDSKQIPSQWPTSCTSLKTLHLEEISSESLIHVMDSFNETSLYNLETLVVRYCSLLVLPLGLMKPARNLRHLDLTNNKFNQEAILQFPVLKDLMVLYISQNQMGGKNLIELLPKVPSVDDLNIDIHKGDLEIFEVRQALTKLSHLKRFSSELQSEIGAFRHDRFAKLDYLNCSKYQLPATMDHLRLYALPTTEAPLLTVNLLGASTKYISIGPDFVDHFDSINKTHTSYWPTNKGYRLAVLMDSVDCECNNDVLARALREFPYYLAMPGLKCTHGGLFKDEPMENLSCRKATVNGCRRKLSRGDKYTTVVDCSNNVNKFRWPKPQGFSGLNASGNEITSLDKAYLPDTLKWIDLSNNNISRLNGEQVSRLFGSKGRRLWIARNPIICDCDNYPLINSLHTNPSLIMDYDTLFCEDSGKLLRLISVPELCRASSVRVLVICSVLAVIILVAALFVRHNWNTLRMILYAHGFCVSCLQEEDVEDSRPYDAFLSFAHGDDEYVMQHLLPKLEGDPNFYRICVHYRDWAVGQWIPAQIIHSVQMSKRTIIVLSKNFIKSCWGVLEFRHAQAGAMTGGRPRLLVLLLDDNVLSEKMSTELQGYLELNTYLKCSDPWFWEKLQYAMPHSNISKSESLPDMVQSVIVLESSQVDIVSLQTL